MKHLLIFLMIITLSNVYAETKIGIGSIFTSTKSNFETNSKQLSKRYDKPDKYNSDTTLIGELTFSKKYNDLSISGGLGYSGEAQGVFISTKNKIEKYGNFTSQIFINPFKKEWKNPYALNTKREKTNTYTYGLNLELDKVLNSNFVIKYHLKYKDVRKDYVDYDSLKRDAIFKDFIIGYNIKTPVRGLIFVPDMSYNMSKAKGGSISYNGFAFGLSSIYFKKDLKLILKANIYKKYYNDREPIFLKTRDENSYQIILICNFDNPLNLKNSYLTFTAGYNKKYSNIDFYEESKVFSGVIVGYKF